MKRFVFRLQSVLRLREFELERERTRLVQLEQERARRLAVLSDAEERLARGREILSRESREGADGFRLAMRADGVAAGRFGVARARHAFEEIEPPVAEARERVRVARTRVRSLEKLRDRQADAHRLESLAAEQAEIEEIALGRIARRVNAAREVRAGREERFA